MTASECTIAVVGVGTSPLVELLLADGHHVFAIDISQVALDKLRAAIGEHLRLTTRCADARTVVLDENVDLWHDRAVFHFLVSAADRDAYVTRAAQTVRPGGHLVLATFAMSGPAQCSGLPVLRHDAASIAAAFAPHFVLVDAFELDHLTPWSTHQRFFHALLQRIE